MTPPSRYKEVLEDAIGRAVRAIAPDGADAAFGVERPRDRAHGDFASNAAMRLAKPLGLPPLDAARRLVGALDVPGFVGEVAVAPPGFVNFSLTQPARVAVLGEILAKGADFARGDPKPERVLVEHVSANPTGPVHVGHGRQAAHGSSLARILRLHGHGTVDREYYVNDTGRQIRLLGMTLWLRYLQGAGKFPGALPAQAYVGDYMVGVARELRAAHGGRFEREVDSAPPGGDGDAQADAWAERARQALGDDFGAVCDFAKGRLLDGIREDLRAFGCEFDRWVSEEALRRDGTVDEALGLADRQGLLYERDGAQWFRSSGLGDGKDRVVRRANGERTYFASDFGYHLDKYRRGYDILIIQVGQDHHGYRPRMRAMVSALGRDPGSLEMKMFAMVRLLSGGRPARLTTRGGEFVSLADLAERVGRDAARFTYLTRRSNQALDFDLELAVRESADNPVHYVRYAHARMSGVLRNWGGDPASLRDADAAPLVHPEEQALARHLLAFRETVDTAAREREPHHVAFYLQELAAAFHGYYNREPVLRSPEPLRGARLKLLAAARTVTAAALDLLGVSAPERM